jgi:hypothetical protein
MPSKKPSGKMNKMVRKLGRKLYNKTGDIITRVCLSGIYTYRTKRPKILKRTTIKIGKKKYNIYYLAIGDTMQVERFSTTFFSSETSFPKNFLSELEQKAKEKGFKKIKLRVLGYRFKHGRIGSLIEKSNKGYKVEPIIPGSVFYVKDLEKK